MAPRVNRKLIEKYFDFGNDQAICKLCSNAYKSDRVFNLKTHIIKVHKIKEDDFVNGDKSVSESSNTIIERKFRKHVIKIEISKKQLFRSYIGLVTEDSIPFNILNSENFKNIVDPICRGLSFKYGKRFCLNSSNCKSVLQVVSDNIRLAIKSEVKELLLSLKIDSATRLSRNVFGISAQYIKNNEMQSRILGMVELKGVAASSSRNLATEIINTLTNYEIKLSQIISITSDNGANMIKTTKILSHCSISEDGTEERDMDEENGNEIYLKNIKKFEDSSEMNLGEIQICRCAAHTAQLCALDVMKDSEIKHYLLSSRNLVKFIKKPSNGFRETFQLKSLTVPLLDCPTRWGSTYNMMKSLKNAKDVLLQIESVNNKTLDENFELSDSFWDFVEAYCAAFEPLQYTIVKFQEEQLHYGDFYAEWLKCKICTEKIQERDDNVYTEKIAKSLLRSMEIRTIKLLSNESLISCLYLDPRFNHTLTPTQKIEAANYLKKLYGRIKSISINTDQNNTSEYHTSTLETMQFSHKADEYLYQFLTRNFEPAANETIDVYTKIENLQLPFVRVDCNVLHFWRDKQYSDPELYALSNICFAVPPTQVTIERAFSSLKLILADNRNRLSHSTLENILLVKLNATHLDEAIDALPLFEDAD